MAIYRVNKSFYERRTEIFEVNTDEMTEDQLKNFINLSPDFETDDREGDAEIEDILHEYEPVGIDGGMGDEPMIEYQIERA